MPVIPKLCPSTQVLSVCLRARARVVSSRQDIELSVALMSHFSAELSKCRWRNSIGVALRAPFPQRVDRFFPERFCVGIPRRRKLRVLYQKPVKMLTTISSSYVNRCRPLRGTDIRGGVE